MPAALSTVATPSPQSFLWGVLLLFLLLCVPAADASVISSLLGDDLIPIADDRIPLSILRKARGSAAGRAFGASSSFTVEADQQALAHRWCRGVEEDTLAAFVMGASAAKERESNATAVGDCTNATLVCGLYRVFGTSATSDVAAMRTRESFVVRIVTPSPTFVSSHGSSRVGILEHIASSCNIDTEQARGLGVAASFFGTATIMLHGTPLQVKECIAGAGLVPFILRVCHWHDEVVVHPEIQRILELEAEIAAADAATPLLSAETLAAMGDYSHVVVTIPPFSSTAISGNGGRGQNTVRPRATLSSHYRPSSVREGVVPSLGGYVFTPHSLSDSSEEDYERHFVCGGGGADSASLRCNLTALVAFLMGDAVRSLEGMVSLEVRRTVRVTNKFSRGLLESGVQFEEPFGKGLGLTGEGYVVAVADTGIDYDHCFFRDPSVAVPLNRVDTSHRKIVRYMTIGNNQGDFSPGHGTHVAGSIAGVPFDPSNQYYDFHGVLPKAKLSVWDQSIGSGEGLRGLGNVNDFFGLSYNDGARVHSNSWGSPGSSYSGEAASVDGFTNRNRHMLPIFAAGNDADARCGSSENDLYCDRRTVISPCIAKNVLCVGASMGSYDSWKFAKLGNYMMQVPGYANGKGVRVLKGNFGPTDMSLLADTSLILADPINGCAELRNSGALKGKVVVFVRGACTFISKILAAQKHGAVGALIVNNINGDAIIMGCDDFGDCGVTIANFMVDMASGDALRTYLSNPANSPKATISQTDEQDPHKGEDNLSEFSSHGPTSDNRYKPEVVAVGELVISAFSDANLNSQNCDVWPTQGTSMATPLTSGLVTMVLQYLEEGIHIDGSKNNKAKGLRDVTSSLLKAVIIHAAAPLTGVFDRNARGDWRQLGRAPTSEQGHGKPRLNYSFPTSPSSPIRVFIDDASSVASGSLKEYCIAYNGLADGFTATLTWIDPANRAGAAFTLINNLNLVVVTPDGRKAFHGNMDPSSNASDVRTAGTTEAFDVLNNAEKVRLPGAPAGTYRVRVEGANIPTGTQQFSLVVSGSAAVECPLFCSAASKVCVHGTCSSTGVCSCREGWGGPRCDLPHFTAPQSAATAATVVLEPMQWVYFTVPAVAAPASATHFTMQSLERDGEVDYALCSNRMNGGPESTGGCVAKDTACQTCGTAGPPATPAPVTIAHTPNAARVLGINAQCCYRSSVRISAAGDGDGDGSGGDGAVPEVTRFVAAHYTLQGSVTVALAITSASLVAANPAQYRVVLRSSGWGATPMSDVPSYHACAIDAVDVAAGHVSCEVTTIVCARESSGAFFTVALISAASGDVVSAPHPSVVHLRCGAFAPASQQQQIDTPSPQPSSTTAQGSGGYHTVPPDPSVAIPSVEGLRVPTAGTASALSRKLCVPLAESNGRVYTIAGSGFADATAKGLLVVKMTAQRVSSAGVEDTQLSYGSGVFTEVLPAATTDDAGVQFSLPSSVLQMAAACSADATVNCGVVRVIINVVMKVTGADAVGEDGLANVIFIADLTIFILSSPRIIGIAMEELQSDAPDALVLEGRLTVGAAEVAQYLDPLFMPEDAEKATRWLYFKGRFFSDARSSTAYGAMLQGSAVVAPSTNALFVRIRTGSDQVAYCGLLKALRDELMECMIVLSTIGEHLTSSALSTALPVEARFPGDGDAHVQSMLSLAIGPCGVVSGLSDRIGTVVPEPRLSPYLTITMVGKQLPYASSDLLVITAQSVTELATPHRLTVLYATADRIIARFDDGVVAKAKSGTYSVSIALTSRIPLHTTPFYFSHKGGEGGAAYLTGVSLPPPSGAGADVPEPTAEVQLAAPSTNAALAVLAVHGVGLDMLLADSAIVRLTCVVETVETHELCRLDTLSSTPARVLCSVSPFASGRCRVEMVAGQYRVPALSVRGGRSAALYVSTAAVLGGPPLYATAFSFDTVLLVGATTRATMAGDLSKVWSEDRANVGLYVSATPCYAPSIIGSSRMVVHPLTGAIEGFDLVATSQPKGVAHVCFGNGGAMIGGLGSPSSVLSRVMFYTRVSLDVIVVGFKAVELTPSFSSVQSFDLALQLSASLAGNFVNTVFAYSDIVLANESCGAAAGPWNANGRAHWDVYPEDGSPFLEAAVARVLVSRGDAVATTPTRLCVALSTNVNDVTLPADRFVYAFTTLDCVVGAADGLPCSGAGACAAGGGGCTCDPWRGGQQCSSMCEIGFDGATCSGYSCLQDGTCDCGASATVDVDGNTFRARGPACQVPAQQVSLPLPRYISPTALTADSSLMREVFPNAPIYAPPASVAIAGSHGRPLPIVMELGGEGMAWLGQMAGSSSVSAVTAASIALDVVVVGPARTRSIAVRLHRNDSRLLHPIGAMYIHTADDSVPPLDGSSSASSGYLKPTTVAPSALSPPGSSGGASSRRVLRASVPLYASGCVTPQSAFSFPVGGAAGSKRSAAARRGCYLVVEVQTDDTMVDGGWSHAAVGLQLRHVDLPFSSLETLVVKGIVNSDQPRSIVMERLDTSAFTSVFALLGVVMSLAGGILFGFTVLAKSKSLTLQGPWLMMKSVFSLCCCCCFGMGSRARFSRGGEGEGVGAITREMS